MGKLSIANTRDLFPALFHVFFLGDFFLFIHSIFSGGPDGIRTRALCRDRAAL